jgi:hypothetical protein
VVDVGGAIDHGDHGDHCLQAAGGLHLAPEEKLGALFHEEESGRCCLFLAVDDANINFTHISDEFESTLKGHFWVSSLFEGL